MANFAYAEGGEDNSDYCRTLEIALRDTCVLNYRRGYDLKGFPEWQE